MCHSVETIVKSVLDSFPQLAREFTITVSSPSESAGRDDIVSSDASGEYRYSLLSHTVTLTKTGANGFISHWNRFAFQVTCQLVLTFTELFRRKSCRCFLGRGELALVAIVCLAVLQMMGTVYANQEEDLSSKAFQSELLNSDLKQIPSDWNAFDYRTPEDFEWLFGKPQVKPPRQEGEKIDLWCGLEISDLSDIHPERGTYRVRGYCWMYYTDPRFRYDGATTEFLSWKYSDLSGLVWTPQMEFVNSIENPEMWLESIDVWPDGSVSRTFGFAVTLSDQHGLMDFTWFPCDTLQLGLEVNTTYESEFLTMHWCKDTETKHALSDSLLNRSPSFVYKNPTVKVYDKTYRAGGISHHSTMQLTWEARRRKGYYFFHIVMPVTAILCVFSAGLLVRLAAFDAKNALCLTCLLSMLAYSIVIVQDLPRLGYLTFGDVLILFAYLLLAVGTICNTIEKWHGGIRKPSVSVLRLIQTALALTTFTFTIIYSIVFLMI